MGGAFLGVGVGSGLIVKRIIVRMFIVRVLIIRICYNNGFVNNFLALI